MVRQLCTPTHRWVMKRAKDDLTMDRSDFSGGGGGVKVLKKGDAGHGGGKKRLNLWKGFKGP